jgi:acyl-CoA synthetase (AMP-forming)/AMP-acid ligase II
MVSGLVNDLQELGIGHGERVVLLLPTSLETSCALLAVMTVATAVPLNPASFQDNLVRAARAGATVILAHEADAQIAQDIADATGARVITLFVSQSDGAIIVRGRQRYRIAAQNAPVSPNQAALIFSTSGTTGVPSLVPLTHRQLFAASRAFARAVRLTADDCCLNVGTLFHVPHIANLLPMLQVGGATAIVPDGQPATVLDVLQRFPISWVIGAPLVYRALLQMAQNASSPITAPLVRFLVCAGTQLPEKLAVSIEAAFGAPVLNLYGMTEARSIALSPLRAGRRKPGGVGPVLCGELRIVDERGRTLPAGGVGEIVTRGPHVFSGYLDDAAANATAFLAGGWFRTGDVGYLDEDEFLFVTGRLKEQINRGGEKILPAEIEDVLLAHPAVHEAAAFGVPDPVLEEDVVAAVVMRPGKSATPRQLRSWMLDRLPPSKTPRRVWFVQNLPRTTTGKVRRGELSRLWREAQR